jgi:hypothetical protein
MGRDLRRLKGSNIRPIIIETNSIWEIEKDGYAGGKRKRQIGSNCQNLRKYSAKKKRTQQQQVEVKNASEANVTEIRMK